MFARKENKEYRITDSMKSAYLNDGYDIYNEKGEIIEHSPKKTITINEHLKAVAELETQVEELKAELVKANEVPKTAKDLKAANDALTKDNEDLKAKVADLEAKVEELTKAGEDNGKVQE